MIALQRIIGRQLQKIVIVLLCCLPGVVIAHDTATVELQLNWSARSMLVELDLQDLDYVLGLDADGDGRLSVSDTERRATFVDSYLESHLDLSGCELARSGAFGFRMGEKPRLIAPLQVKCDGALSKLEIQSRLLEELPDYRTLLRYGDDASGLLVLESGQATIDVGRTQSRTSFRGFIGEGFRHILTGFDHLVFLLLLVLPVAGQSRFRIRLIRVAGIATAFTLAHSITLTLSALGHLVLPARPVEIMIAASVVLVGVLNVTGRVERFGWAVAYSFGLIHGFGFAGAFAELASGTALGWSDILGFNLGVELGQLLLISLGLLALYPFMATAKQRRVLVPVGSLAAAAVGVFWIVQRL